MTTPDLVEITRRGGTPSPATIDDELAAFEAAERARLGLPERRQWVDAMTRTVYTKRERQTTTLLVGGLTIAHDYFVEGALRGRGYNVRHMQPPNNAALRLGKEFGNRGQCNPTYFTVGNLVAELTRIRDEEGMSPEEIIRRYVFLTAGACGPCRFGMYVTEYRKALRDAGFDGFRVLLFQQSGGFKQATGDDAGLVLDPPFFAALAKALLAGDVLNAVGYRIRPYEVEAGATDIALAECKTYVYQALVERRSVLVALRRARKRLASVAVDRTQPKPTVAIIGEFWAMTTEGDGNYQLQRFLESEGAECDTQLVTAWLLYLLWEGRQDLADRAKLRATDGGKKGLGKRDVGRSMATLWVGDVLARITFRRFAAAVGLRDYRLPDMNELARVSRQYYNPQVRGGEGHMEVGKLILNTIHHKAHMTVSVKPFGCMPSSGVSDGVQSAVTENYPDAIFCAVETNGDGAVNFYSRIQMSLSKARQRAGRELSATLLSYGLTRERATRFLAKSRYGNALYRPPRRSAGSSADLIHAIGPLAQARWWQWPVVSAAQAIARARDIASHEGAYSLRVAREAAPAALAIGRWVVTELPQMILTARRASRLPQSESA
jgi:predicted nucleotide-binding protein (sugar kinase/HSP70/actin superfamily)